MTTTDVLRGVPLFQGMSDRSIASIAELATPTSFEAGSTLIVEDTPGDTFIVLTAGSAEVTRAGRRLRTVAAGDFLGEISLIDGGPRTATVTASTPVETLVIDRDGFARLMSEFAVVRLDVVSALTHRLRERSRLETD
jgi:CRP/FNR family cyclic AMP-dependent transcriptional regulator